MDIRDAGLIIIMALAFIGLLMWAYIRISARRTADKMWQEALADKSGRKMRSIENWIERGGPPPM